MITGSITKNSTNNVMNNFLLFIVISYVLFQLIGILRATGIYDTVKISNVLNVVISMYIFIFMAMNLNRIKMNYFEVILIVLPILYFFYGALMNGVSRDLFADTYTAIFFGVLLTSVRSSVFTINNKRLLTYANIMMCALLISTIIYKVAPFMGIRVFSVSTTSIFFILPHIIFFVNKKSMKAITSLLLLIIASKRGVIISLIGIYLIVGFSNKTIKKTTRLLVLVITLLIVFIIVYITIIPSRFASLPSGIQPVLYKTMFVNPFSEYNRLSNDARVLEMISAIRPFIQNPLLIITGAGSGYSYDLYDRVGNLIVTNNHNVHFSPITIFTRYGILYFIVLYGYILKLLFQNNRLYKKRKLGIFEQIMFFYAIGALINSFTAFTIYIDYLFIFSLGVLSKYKRKSDQHKNINDTGQNGG